MLPHSHLNRAAGTAEPIWKGRWVDPLFIEAQKEGVYDNNTVGGFRNPVNSPVEVFSRDLQGFVSTRWLFGISSINRGVLQKLGARGIFLPKGLTWNMLKPPPSDSTCTPSLQYTHDTPSVWFAQTTLYSVFSSEEAQKSSKETQQNKPKTHLFHTFSSSFLEFQCHLPGPHRIPPSLTCFFSLHGTKISFLSSARFSMISLNLDLASSSKRYLKTGPSRHRGTSHHQITIFRPKTETVHMV